MITLYRKMDSVLCKGFGRPGDHADLRSFNIELHIARHTPKSLTRVRKRNSLHDGSVGAAIEPEKVGELPLGNWTEEIDEIKRKLREAGFYLPTREELCKVLPFEADIPTIIGPTEGQPHRVFDAIFYWED